jgi:hypothetical protein
VIDANDPQQMGRIRVMCAAWGDNASMKVRDVPFALPVSPLAGLMVTGKRGVEEAEVEGPTAYGMWNVPKIGSYVMVGCVDGHRGRRFYIGGINPQYMTHTMPHGRFTWQDQTNGKPDGPLDTFENPIEPLYSNLEKQFTKQGDKHAPGTPSDPRQNMEWRSRGVDRQTSGIDSRQTAHPEDGPGNKIADTKPGEPISITQEDGTEYQLDGPGYSVNQVIENLEYEYTKTGYDSQVYSWTTPGFHAFSMDDRKDNCRIRIRTTSGHQILMDDTNERIYISAAGGESWIEIDKVGNIDIYASKNISTRAGGDINFYSDKTIRMQAKEGIHMRTDGDFRAHSVKDFNIRTEAKFRTHSADETRIESDADMHIRVTGSTMYILADQDIHVKSARDTFLSQNGILDINTTQSGAWTTGQRMDHMSGANMYFTAGPDIHLNGPQAEAAQPASDALQSQEFWAYWTSRVPEHEPWARVFMKKEGSQGADNNGPNNEAGTLTFPNTHTPEYDYTSTDVGKGSKERGETYTRNKYWHR